MFLVSHLVNIMIVVSKRRYVINSSAGCWCISRHFASDCTFSKSLVIISHASDSLRLFYFSARIKLLITLQKLMGSHHDTASVSMPQ